MKVIIAGGRDFNDYTLLKEKCDYYLSNSEDIEIVSGTAHGADMLGERYAAERGYLVRKFPADWDRYGKSAGYKRNMQMAMYGDTLIAFWDQKSKGTMNMIDIANKKGLEVKVVIYE